jgi:D-alanine-D-alanine ligase
MSITQRQSVVLLHGGRSSEHEISCVTAAGILAAIDRNRFDVISVGITREGAMVLVPEDEMTYAIDAEAMPRVRDNGSRVLWPESTRARELRVLEDGVVRSIGNVDVVMPMLHGPFGEDGTVQGMCEFVDLPYVGSGVLGSALCMDKNLAKTVLASAGIAVAPWRTITRAQLDRDPSVLARLDEGLHYPLFVKPARAGSSVGVSRVTEPEQLAPALDVAFAEDHSVLIESGVTGREVEIGVLAGRHGETPRTSSVIGEIVFSGRDFYDYEAKYLGAAGVSLVFPADVTDAEYESIKSAAIRSFEATQCAGYARIDFFLTEHGPVINEINTLPGFTPVSMFPQLWAASGMPYTELITELIELGLQTER